MIFTGELLQSPLSRNKIGPVTSVLRIGRPGVMRNELLPGSFKPAFEASSALSVRRPSFNVFLHPDCFFAKAV
jgi:hypothetical protein